MLDALKKKGGRHLTEAGPLPLVADDRVDRVIPECDEPCRAVENLLAVWRCHYGPLVELHNPALRPGWHSCGSSCGLCASGRMCGLGRASPF